MSETGTDTDEATESLSRHVVHRVLRQFHRFCSAFMIAFKLYCTTLRAFFFPDTFQLYSGTLVRGLFTLYYIPFLAMIFAVTHSALQRVVWVLIIPVAQEMERNPYNYSYWATFLYGLSSIVVRILPFATLGLSVLTVGYKVQHCVGEAMMDAFVRRDGEDYPLLHARFRFMRENRRRELVFLVVLAFALAALVVLLHTNAFVTWTMSGERSTMLAAGWTIVLVEACFVTLTALVGAPKDVMEKQWNSLVKPIRRALTAPSALETPAADPAAVAGEASAASSLASSTGPNSPMPAGGGSSPQPRRRRREPYWRPRLQPPPPSPMPPSSPESPHGRAEVGASGGVSSPSSWERRRHSTTDAMLVSRAKSDADGANWDTSLHTSLASSVIEDEDGGSSSSSSSTDGTGDEDTFLDYFQEDWWKGNIHKMRYIAVALVSLVSLIAGVQRGLVNGLTLGILLIMCLNLPHLVGYTTLAACGAIVRTYRSFLWLHQHQDAFGSFVVLVSPYQVPLMYAIYFFRHHPLTVLLLLGGMALLLARGIDLIREFDVTEKGCVHWRNRQTGELLTPSLAALLESAYSRAHLRPDLVSLDLVIDIQRMRIYDLANKTEVSILRTQVIPYGAARRYLREWDFYSYAVPRMLSLQSSANFTGSQFRIMRVVLRVLMVLLALSVSMITFGILLQAAFPTLRPLPVRVQAARNGSALIFDHVVVRMHLQARRGLVPLYHVDEAVVADVASPVTSSVLAFVPAANASVPPPDAAAASTSGRGDDNSSDVMLNLSNVTSAAGVDFYPQLCTRDYHGTSVWELALLALAPYLYNMDELTTMLQFMNTHLGSDWELRPRHGRSCRPGEDSGHQPTGWTGYFEVHSVSRNTSVLALRGTDLFSFTDFLIDMNLFFEPVLFQVLANTIPGARLLPKELVVDAIHAASLPETPGWDAEEPLESWATLQASTNHSLRRCRPNNYMRNFFADVENHLLYIGSRPSRPRHVIVTGHSMGGAVAAIVASRMGVQAVAFSAPGVVTARKKFGIELMDLHQRVVTVASSSDIVPQMGAQGGEVQHLECLAERRDLCHAMEFMVGTLWRSCSSVRERFPDMDDIV